VLPQAPCALRDELVHGIADDLGHELARLRCGPVHAGIAYGFRVLAFGEGAGGDAKVEDRDGSDLWCIAADEAEDWTSGSRRRPGRARTVEPARVVLELALLLLTDQVLGDTVQIFWTTALRSSSSTDDTTMNLIVEVFKLRPDEAIAFSLVAVAVDVSCHAVEVDAEARIIRVRALVEKVRDRGAVASAEVDAVLAARRRQVRCGQQALEAGFDDCLRLSRGRPSRRQGLGDLDAS
jgi:hypothetical protein